MTGTACGSQVAPLTPDRWPDLVDLFGAERGAMGGCWCTYWRTDCSQKAFHGMGRRERHDILRRRVAVPDAPAPGLLAYRQDQAVGWVSVAPRSEFPRFNRTKASRVDQSADLAAVWAINCFYIRSGFRRSGLMRTLIAGAVDHATLNGAAVIDAAPLDVTRKLIAGEAYVGIAGAFERAGFEVAARQSTSRPLMRLVL